MKIRYISLLLLCSSLNVFSQRTETVHNIKGTAFISGDVSPNQAKSQALVEAKVNALKAAGIDEKLNSYQLLFTSQAKNEYSQLFSSNIASEMQGAIRSFTITSEKVYCKSNAEIVCEVIIDATVVRYSTKSDPAFDMEVSGMKAVYNAGDNLNFDVKATQNSYLTIFSVTDSEATLLYPNMFEPQKELVKLESYKFPKAKIDYALGNNLKKQESNRLIFVLTKTPISFIKMNEDQVTSNENIFTWIYSIPPDQRKVEYFTLTVEK
jgi:hypothetical protein